MRGIDRKPGDASAAPKIGARSLVQARGGDVAAPASKIGGSPRTEQLGLGGGAAGGGGQVQRKKDPAADPAGNTEGDKPPLRDWEIPEELAKLQALRIDDASIRTVQEALETPPTGAFNAADVLALSRLRVAHHLSRYLELSERTIDLLVQKGVALGMQDELLHLVTDVLRIDTRSDVLSIHFSATLEVESMTNFDPAGLRMILIGKKAFHSARTISRAIHDEIAQPIPATTAAGATGGPVPTVLTPDEAEAAAGSNSGIISDERAARAIQRTLDAPVTGKLDVTTAQFVARRQQLMNIAPADGTIDEATLHEIIASLGRSFGEESAIRVILDYYRIPDDGVTSVRFDPMLRDEDFRIESRGTRTAPAVVFGPDAFLQPPARIAHTVGRAFEDVRLRGTGVRLEVRDFLLERFVMSAPNMADEGFVPFMHDAVQALAKYKALAKADQDALSHEFRQVTDKVIARWGAADPDARKPFLEVEDEYMAMYAASLQSGR